MEYKILGNNMPVVECILNAGEKIITEKGSMSWMSSNMVMETHAKGGVLGRIFSGDSIFQNIYTCKSGSGNIAFASSFPGSIIPVEIKPGQEIVAQKSAFLASEEGVKLSIHFKKKLGIGLFGGEGFIMQKLSGNGIAFLEIDGSVIKKTLQPKETIIIDTGYLAAMSGTCSIDIQMVKGAKNLFFGGEGLFNTIVTGPGDVYLQTMPFSNLVNIIASSIPQNTSSN